MIKIIIVSLLSLLLFGFDSTKLIYEYGDKFFSWQLDSYFELNSKQEDWIEERTKFHLKWHREEELPRYKKFLTDIQYMIRDGIKMEEIDEVFLLYESKKKRIFERLIPDVVLFLKSLSLEQINYLEIKMKEENEEIFEENQNMSELIEERQENFLEQMEDWFGEFSLEQNEQLIKWQGIWFGKYADSIELRTKTRIKSQTQFLTLMRSNPDNTELKEWIINWTEGWGREKNPEYNTKILQAKERIMEIDKFINHDQRQHALEELDDWVEIIDQTIVRN